jgi:hypothetical protein
MLKKAKEMVSKKKPPYPSFSDTRRVTVKPLTPLFLFCRSPRRKTTTARSANRASRTKTKTRTARPRAGSPSRSARASRACCTASSSTC